MAKRLPALLAALGLAFAPAAAIGRYASGDTLLLPLCGDPAHRIAIPLKGQRQAPGHDCPAGCHALCARGAARRRNTTHGA